MDRDFPTRFKQLDSLLSAGLITPKEHAERRSALLDQIVALPAGTAPASSGPAPAAPATGAIAGSATVGFEVPINTDGVNFVDAFVSKNLPREARPRLLVDRADPLVVARWMFSTKMLHFQVMLALHDIPASADLSTAFAALRAGAAAIEDADVSEVQVQAASGDLVPNLQCKPRGLISALLPVVFAAGVMRSPLPDRFDGWVAHIIGTKGWASHAPISALARGMGYTVVFE